MNRIVLKEIETVASDSIAYRLGRIGDIKYNYSDSAKATQRLQWQSVVELNEDLSETVTLFMKYRPRVAQ